MMKTAARNGIGKVLGRLALLGWLPLTLNACLNVGTSALDDLIDTSKQDVGQSALQFEPRSVNFGNVRRAPAFLEMPVTITNGASKAIFISAFAVDNAEFSLRSNDCAMSPLSLDPGATCTLVLRFSPGADGDRGGTLRATYGIAVGENTRFSVDLGLAGRSTPDGVGNPGLSFNPSVYDYGNVALGANAERSFTVRNVTDASLYISGFTSDSGLFTLAQNNCPVFPQSVLPNATCTVVLRFTPVTGGQFLASFYATYGASDLRSGTFAAAVAVTGSSSNGSVGNPAIAFNPNYWDFGDTALNGSVQKILAITNTSSATVYMSAIAPELGVNSAFTVLQPGVNGCPTGANPFAAGASCNIIVTFSPGASQSFSDNIKVAYGPTVAQSTSLVTRTVVAGRSSPPPISSATLTFTPGFWDYGDVAANVSVSKQFVIKNVSTNSIYIGRLERSQLTNFALSHNCNTSPAALVAGAECTVTVTFTPTADGSYSSDVVLSYGANSAQSQSVDSKFIVIGRSTSTPIGNAIVSFSPSYFDFGDKAVNTITNQTVTVTNSGTVPIYVGSVAAAQSQFGITSNTCSGSVAAHGTCTFNLRYIPDAVSVFTSEVLLAYGLDSARNNNLGKVMLAAGRSTDGGVGSSAFAFDPTFWDFGDVAAGVTVQKVITVTNSSADPVYISNVTRTSPAIFGISHDCPVSPSALAANGTCSLVVNFGPSADGVQSSLISILYGPDAPRSANRSAKLSVSGRSTAVTRGNPALTYNPTYWDFGDVPRGTVVEKTFRLTNVSAAAVNLSNINLSASGSFVIAGHDCPTGSATLAGADFCNITVRFSPVGDTVESLALRTAYGPDFQRSGNQVASVIIAGRSLAVPAGQSILTATPAFPDYGDVAQGNTVTQSIVLTNASAGNVYLSALTRSNTAVFALTHNCPASPAALAASASCTVNLTFAPNAEGAHQTRVDVVHGTSAAGSGNLTYSFYAQGRSTAAATGNAALAFSPTFRDFGDVAAGQSSTLQFTVTNSSGATLSLGGATLNNARFTVTANTCGATLLAAASCLVDVRFAPVVDGAQSALLAYTYGPDSPRSGNLVTRVAVAGRSTAAPLGNQAITYAPSSWDYGDVAAGQVSARAFAVTNAYSDPLFISGFASSNAKFTLTDNCPRSPASLASAATCTVTATFAPTADGGQAGDVSIAYGPDAARSANLHAVLAVTGRSTAVPVGNPSLAFSPTYRDYGNVLVGQNSTLSFTVQNTKSAALFLGAASVGSARYAITANNCPSGSTALAGNASCTISFKYTPTVEQSDITDLEMTYGPDVHRATNLVTKAVLIAKSEPPPVGNAALALSPNTHDFGNVPLSPGSSDVTITVTNSSARALYIGSMTGLAAPYSINQTTCPASPLALAAAASCTVKVRFSPIAGPQVTQTLSVNYGTSILNTLEFNSQAQLTGRSNPNPPTNFNYVSGTANSVTFSWDANDFDQSSFEVQRCDGAVCTSTFTAAATYTAGLTNTVRQYSVASLTEGAIHQFRVRGVQGATRSAWLTGDLTMVFGGVQTVDNSTGASAGLSQINCGVAGTAGPYVSLTWHSVPSAAYYQIFDLVGGVRFVKNVDAPAAGTILTGLTSGQAKNYVVKAFTETGVSSPNIATTDLLTQSYSPCVALGQPSFAARDIRYGMQNPRDIYIAGGKLFVADQTNNRVLIWNTIPTSNGAPADVVLGQNDFTSIVANNSGTQEAPALRSAKSLSSPQGIFVKGTKLYVADTNNQRVLIWNTIPTTNFAAADLVLGQSNFATGGAIGTTNCPLAAYAGKTMYNPRGVFVDDDNYLYVVDSSNNRVMVWTTPPTGNGQASDLVLGMANYAANCPGATTAQNTFNAPEKLYVSGAGAGAKVFVADRGNKRVLVFTKPLSNGMNASARWGVANYTTIGANTCTQTTMADPIGIWGDSTAGSANVWVADYGCNRVVKFASTNWGDAPSADGLIGGVNGNPGTATAWTAGSASNGQAGMNGPLAGFASSGADAAGGGVWVSNYAGNRIHRYGYAAAVANVPTALFNANLVVGSPRFGNGAGNNNLTLTNWTGVSAQRLLRPAAISVGTVQRRMAVADFGANRVLLYDTVPTGHSPAASRTLGQTTASGNENNLGGVAAQNSLSFPQGVWTDGEKVLVADTTNNRVMGWKSWPTADAQNANFVIGQAAFSAAGAAVTANGLNGPTDVVSSDYPGSTTYDYIWIADTSNNRILAYTTTWSNSPADPPLPPASASPILVLGQSTFTTNAAPNPPTSASLNTPRGIWSDGRRVVIADSNNNRVLIWDQANTPGSGGAADFVLGQSDFVSRNANQGGTATEATMSYPTSIAVDDRGTAGDTSDDRLMVVDHSNHRILVWNSWPTSSGQSADRVIGQATFNNSSTNAGYAFPIGISFAYPYRMVFDIGRMFVTDGLSVNGVNINVMTNGRGLVFPSY